MKRLVVAISGASGVIYGVRMLETLAGLGVETHLVITDSGVKNLSIETKYTIDDLRSMASFTHDVHNVGSSIASGSFHTDGMVIAPSSIKTLLRSQIHTMKILWSGRRMSRSRNAGDLS